MGVHDVPRSQASSYVFSYIGQSVVNTYAVPEYLENQKLEKWASIKHMEEFEDSVGLKVHVSIANSF